MLPGMPVLKPPNIFGGFFSCARCVMLQILHGIRLEIVHPEQRITGNNSGEMQ
jgi:hypothetical protein